MSPNPLNFRNLMSKINHKILEFRLLRDPILHSEVSASPTSISDGSNYSRICELAIKEQAVYNNFRRYKSYFNVLEHVSKELGGLYAHYLFNNDPKLKTFFKSKSQNNIGRPIKFYYRKFGYTSPTLLRYLKVLEELTQIFGTLEDKVITEIGIGYGGQVATILQNVNVSAVYMFDLNEVNLLASKFLDGLNLEKKYVFYDGRSPLTVHSDLVISNYAFSELNRETQEIYLKNIISNSKSGYITWNDLGYRNLNSFSLEELLNRIPKAQVIDEFPLTAEQNKIIIWGNKAI